MSVSGHKRCLDAGSDPERLHKQSKIESMSVREICFYCNSDTGHGTWLCMDFLFNRTRVRNFITLMLQNRSTWQLEMALVAKMGIIVSCAECIRWTDPKLCESIYLLLGMACENLLFYDEVKALMYTCVFMRSFSPLMVSNEILQWMAQAYVAS